MKKLLFFFLIFCAASTQAQQLAGPSGYGNQFDRLAANLFFKIPVLPDTTCNLVESVKNGTCDGALMILQSDSLLYMHIGPAATGFWKAVGAAPDLSGYVQLTQLNDTLINFLRKTDTHIYIANATGAESAQNASIWLNGPILATQASFAGNVVAAPASTNSHVPTWGQVKDSLSAQTLETTTAKGNTTSYDIYMDYPSQGRYRFMVSGNAVNRIYSMASGGGAFRPMWIGSGGLVISDIAGSLVGHNGVDALQVQGSGKFVGPVQVAAATADEHAIRLGQFWQQKLTPLLTEPATPVQPTDSLPQAIGKLQSQINAQDGLSIKNQYSSPQDANGWIQGAFKIQSLLKKDRLWLQRGVYDTSFAIVSFQNTAGDIVANMGLGREDMLNHLDLINLVAGFNIAHNDTSALTVGNQTLLTSSIHTGHKLGRWLYTNAANPYTYFNSFSNYTRTINIRGSLGVDSLFASNSNITLDHVTSNNQNSTNAIRVTGFGVPNRTGAGVEIGYTSGEGYVQSYNPGVDYTPLNITSSDTKFTGPVRILSPYVPTSTADSNGAIGQIGYDDSYLYIKTSAGWKRATLSTF